MPKEWEIELGLPDISGIFVLLTVCVLSMLLLFCCATSMNTIIQNSGGSSEMLRNLSYMPINACLSLIEISALLVAAAVSFTYLLRFLQHGSTKSSSTKTNLPVITLLLASVILEIIFAAIIACASNTEPKYLIFLPLAFLAIAILIFFIVVVIAVRKLYIYTLQEKKAIYIHRLIKLLSVGIMSGGLFIVALIISLISTIYQM